MGKANDNLSLVEDMMKSVAAPSAMASQAETFWRSYGAASRRAKSFLDAWFDRRAQAAADAHRCCEELIKNGGDATATANAWSEWTRSEMDRLQEDAAGQFELGAELMREAVGALGAAAGEDKGEAPPPKARAVAAE